MRTAMITEPAVEPVTVDEVKEHCAIESNGDNSLLARMIKVARLRGEAKTGRQFVTATRETTFDRWVVDGDIELPYPPLQSVASISYVDDNGDTQTVSTDDYEVITAGVVGMVRPVDQWPTGKTMTIRYVCGYALDTDDDPTTPEDIRHWIMMKVAGFYEQREGFVVGQPIAEAPSDFVDGLLDAYRVQVVV